MIQGLMWPAGIAAYEKRDEAKSGVYRYENEPVTLDSEFEKKFMMNEKAWTFFQSQTPSNQKVAIRWVMTAKQPVTRLSHLNALINDCEEGVKIKPLRFGANNK